MIRFHGLEQSKPGLAWLDCLSFHSKCLINCFVSFCERVTFIQQKSSPKEERRSYALKRTFAWFPLNLVLWKMTMSKLELSITLSPYTLELNNWNQDKSSQGSDIDSLYCPFECWLFFFSFAICWIRFDFHNVEIQRHLNWSHSKWFTNSHLNVAHFCSVSTRHL